MRSDEEILAYILQAKQDKAERERIENERQTQEHAHKQVFFQASRVVLVNTVLPTMERIGTLCERAGLRSQIVDTGAYYLPGAAPADMMCRFQMPIVSRPMIDMPLAVSFKAIFPIGMAVYYSDINMGQAEAKGPVEEYDLTEITPEVVEDRVLQILANYMHES
jgi:hypothetical protein